MIDKLKQELVKLGLQTESKLFSEKELDYFREYPEISEEKQRIREDLALTLFWQKIADSFREDNIERAQEGKQFWEKILDRDRRSRGDEFKRAITFSSNPINKNNTKMYLTFFETTFPVGQKNKQNILPSFTSLHLDFTFENTPYKFSIHDGCRLEKGSQYLASEQYEKYLKDMRANYTRKPSRFLSQDMIDELSEVFIEENLRANPNGAWIFESIFLDENIEQEINNLVEMFREKISKL